MGLKVESLGFWVWGSEFRSWSAS